jgi:heme oxygenase (biliverdin-IX-beta and delta-forming)
VPAPPKKALNSVGAVPFLGSMLTDDLRTQTRQQHQQLEAINALPTTRSAHVAQLTAFYGFIAPWEQKLADALPESDPIRRDRAKTAWLEADLDFFGCDAAQRDALPRAEHLPSTASRDEILGAAYVLEGATLGGQIISRHLEHTLGLRDGGGYRFFLSYGPDVSSQWQKFRTELLQASSVRSDPIIVSAARETFSLLAQWFSRCRLSRGLATT